MDWIDAILIFDMYVRSKIEDERKRRRRKRDNGAIRRTHT